MGVRAFCANTAALRRRVCGRASAAARLRTRTRLKGYALGTRSFGAVTEPFCAERPEPHFFAAQTLHTKAKRDWRQHGEHSATVVQ